MVYITFPIFPKIRLPKTIHLMRYKIISAFFMIVLPKNIIIGKKLFDVTREKSSLGCYEYEQYPYFNTLRNMKNDFYTNSDPHAYKKLSYLTF